MVFFAVLPLLAPSLFGKEGTTPFFKDQVTGQQTIRVNSHLVLVPVSVTDASGQPVKDLRQDDFSVFENGNPVPLAKVGEPGQTRLEIALLFDISGSVNSRFDFELQAAAGFLEKLFKPGDSVSILSIGSIPSMIQDRTGSLAAALQGLQSLSPSGEATAFFDCVVAAAQALSRQPDPDARRVQVVLSDGEDNRSDKAGLMETVRHVQETDCIFYSINPGGRSLRTNKLSQQGQAGMQILASQTGGAAFVAEELDELDAIFSRIAAELQAQYLLTYYSPDVQMDGAFRRIWVEVPTRPGLRVRARQGYYAVETMGR